METILKKWNEYLLKEEYIDEYIDSEIFNNKWLGSKGAPEEDINDLETRIGCELPSSYKDFFENYKRLVVSRK